MWGQGGAASLLPWQLQTSSLTHTLLCPTILFTCAFVNDTAWPGTVQQSQSTLFRWLTLNLSWSFTPVPMGTHRCLVKH